MECGGGSTSPSQSSSSSFSTSNGSSQSFTFPAEDKLCNPRLDAETRARLAACIPSRASSIW